MDDILLLGIFLTLLNVIYALVGYFGSTKEAVASRSVAHGATSLAQLGEAVDNLSHQASVVAARADQISDRKLGLTEQKLKEEHEAAVEAVVHANERKRIKDAELFADKFARALAEKDAAYAALDAKRKRQLEEAKVAHEEAMRDHEEKLTTHFAMVLAKVTTSTGGQVDATVFEYTPMVFPPPEGAGGAAAVPGSGGMLVTEDHELISSARSLVALAHDHLKRAEKLADTRLRSHSFETLDASTLGGDASVPGGHSRGGASVLSGGGGGMAAEHAKNEAEVAFRAALALDPSCVEAIVGLAELGVSGRAEATALLAKLRAAIDVDGKCAAAWHSAGHLLCGLGRWRDAADHFHEAIKHDHRNPEYKAAFEEARTQFNGVLSKEAAREVFASSHADHNLARQSNHLVNAGERLLGEHGGALDATRAFGGAILLDPTSVPAYAGLAEAHLKRGDLLRALDAAYAALACDGLSLGGATDESARQAMEVLQVAYDRRGDVSEASAWGKRLEAHFRDSHGDDDSSVVSQSTRSSAGSKTSFASRNTAKSQATNISALTQGTAGAATLKSKATVSLRSSPSKAPSAATAPSAAGGGGAAADDDNASQGSQGSQGSAGGSSRGSRSINMNPDNK